MNPKAGRSLKRWVLEMHSRGYTRPGEHLFASQKRKRNGETRPITRNRAWQIIYQACIEAGVTGKIGTHTMRKTFATNVYEATGHSIPKTMEATGHTDVKSLMKYLGYSRAEVEKVILNL